MTFPRLPTAMSRMLADMPFGGTERMFTTMHTRAVIEEGARAGLRVRLTYHKKSTGNVVNRTVSPYEFKRGYLYAKHGHTKSFIVDRIRHAEMTEQRARPDYPVNI